MGKWNRGGSRGIIRGWLLAVVLGLCFVATDARASGTNVSSGNLSHDQAVFATSGGSASLGLSLLYESLGTYSGSLGFGWIHSADIFLTVDANGNVLLRNVSSRIYYRKNGSGYLSQPGDSSTLTGATGSFAITQSDGSRYAFGANNRIATITDRFGNAQTFGYDTTSGDLTSIGDSAGRTAILEYDTTVTPHRLAKIAPPGVTVSDVDQKKYQLTYTGGRLSQVLNPLADQLPGSVRGHWDYTYHADGKLKTVSDPAGNITRYNYDQNGRVQSVVDPEGLAGADGVATVPGHTKSLVYNGNSTTTLTEKDGGKWLYTYDTQKGRLTSKQGPDASGNPGSKGNIYYYYPVTYYVKAMTEPFGDNEVRTTFYAYDGNGNQTRQTDPLPPSAYGNISPDNVDTAAFGTAGNPAWAITSQYDNSGYNRITSTSDLRSTPALTTTYAYTTENGGEVVTVTAPGNFISVTKNNADGTIRQTTDANGKATTYTYYPDSTDNRAAGIVGTLYEITGADGVVTRFTQYDRNGNPLEIRTVDTAQREIRTVQTFDALNRLRTATRYAQGLPDNVTNFGYDYMGNRTSVIDPESHETKYQNNYRAQVTKVTDARQKDTVYTYGGTGCPSCGGGADKLTAVTDANQHTTSFAYDTLGRLERETDPLNKIIRYTYYDNGLLREKYNATGGDPGTLLITYFYNEHGQLTEKRYPDNTSVKFTYKPDGRLDTAGNYTGSTVTFGYTYEYYDNGRLKSVTDNSGRKISYDDYDGIGQTKKVTYFPGTADEHVINYDYDTANRPWHIVSNAGTFTFAYDPLSRRNLLTYPSAVIATYGYDDLNRLTSLSHQYQATTIASFSYTHDQAGNRKTKSGTSNETYGYDEVYRLLQAVTPRGTENYTYDEVGNRQTGPGAKDTAYRYNNGNQMTSGRTFGYTYDNAGNQAARTVAANAGKDWTLTWDYENRLTKMEKTKGAEKRTIDFKYDPLGRRIGKDLTTVINGVAKTSSWLYVYDNDNIALEIFTDGGNAPVKTFYTHGLGVDEHLAMERGGSYYYYHADGLGSTVAVSDPVRNVVQRYTYDSFGMGKPANNTFSNSYTYTGREWDKETGLYYYRARYYDPMEGRFISKDPIGFDGGDVNLFAYVQNSPTTRNDPTGLMVQLCSRPSDSLFGFFRFIPHFWIKTDTKEAGMGPKGAGAPGGNCQCAIITTINSHVGQKGTCTEVKDEDEACVNRELELGKYTGIWPFNNCLELAMHILNKCKKSNPCH